MPLEVCKIARASRSKICKNINYSNPDRGFCASQNTRYYGYKLHAVCSVRGVIESLIVDDVPITGQDGDACRNFYRDIFSTEPIYINVVNDFTCNLPFLVVEDKLFCEGCLTAAECLEALKGMKDGNFLANFILIITVFIDKKIINGFKESACSE